MLVFFMLFLVVSTFSVLNVMTALIVENTMCSARMNEADLLAEQEKRRKKELRRLRAMFEKADTNNDGTLSLPELQDALCRTEVKQVLLAMGVMPSDAVEIFMLLDVDGDGQLTPSEVLTMAYRLVHSETDQFQFNCVLLSLISNVMSSVRSLGQSLERKMENEVARAAAAAEGGGGADRAAAPPGAGTTTAVALPAGEQTTAPKAAAATKAAPSAANGAVVANNARLPPPPSAVLRA